MNKKRRFKAKRRRRLIKEIRYYYFGHVVNKEIAKYEYNAGFQAPPEVGIEFSYDDIPF